MAGEKEVAELIRKDRTRIELVPGPTSVEIDVYARGLAAVRKAVE